jgi:hypothetical protein
MEQASDYIEKLSIPFRGQIVEHTKNTVAETFSNENSSRIACGKQTRFFGRRKQRAEAKTKEATTLKRSSALRRSSAHILKTSTLVHFNTRTHHLDPFAARPGETDSSRTLSESTERAERGVVIGVLARLDRGVVLALLPAVL